MNRKSITAYTEETTSYPAFVSINMEPDGMYSITVRERGHNGEKQATLQLHDADLLKLGIAIVAETDPR